MLLSYDRKDIEDHLQVSYTYTVLLQYMDATIESRPFWSHH